MQSRNVVIRRNSCNWRPGKKRKTEIQRSMSVAGFINPVVGVAVFAVFAGLLYIYSINQSAVKGYQIRQIEKEISQIKGENESLRIREAELKSLYKIEQASKDLNMSKADSVTYLEGANPLALNMSAR
ncbi:MAG: Septum formation initiator [Candidatus Moranbacteria bacterium GW2011_GWE1_49_15]|nr:MAG: Septum formation initiator [Candidatus Moranbacteria bacterium GW2011_GWE2_47_10]KKW06738.1 MAG: Septum formation initiator [Candidatus Moranbacteria bacterium GW2011_GWE1_49_15]HBP00780.1 hypothetical protein [Candidatus Moranbacteria bacterium]